MATIPGKTDEATTKFVGMSRTGFTGPLGRCVLGSLFLGRCVRMRGGRLGFVVTVGFDGHSGVSFYIDNIPKEEA